VHQFEFRLQRVLDYRELQEGWAKDALMAARASRLQAEATLVQMANEKQDALSPQGDIRRLISLESYVALLEDRIASQESVIAILSDEEQKAHADWNEARTALKSLLKLRERAELEWQQEMQSAEQSLLDEWTQSRRDAS
jgi:flagellar export protein FliJ